MALGTIYHQWRKRDGWCIRFYPNGKVSNNAGGWRYLLEAASFYSPPSVPNNNRLLAELNYTHGTEQIEDKTKFYFLNRLAPTVAFLKSIGVWSNPHPWLDLFVAGSAVNSFVGEVAANLTLADTGLGPILLYPVKTNRFHLPLFWVPTEEIVFLFSILLPSSTTRRCCSYTDAV